MTGPKIRPNRRATAHDRVRALAKLSHARVQVAPVPNAADDDTTSDGGSTASTTAELWLYGVVGGYWWGFDAESVADALRQLPDDITEIRVRVHSPGGSALEGIAIKNLLANHPARITMVVDGLAASAASVLILAGDDIVVSPGAQVMIHDCSTFTYGNAEQLRSDADWIDKQSANYAEVYAARGGDAAEWREAMVVDRGRGTWYTAAEAVEANLADRVATIQSTTPPPAEPDADELEIDEDELAARAAYDRDVLVHPDAWATWSATPGAMPRPPKPPTASAEGSTTTEGNRAVKLSDDAVKTLTAKLGLTDENADEATILAAVDEVLAEQTTEPTPSGTTTTPTAAVPDGMVLMDSATAAALREQAAQGAAARTQQLTEHRDRTISAAIGAGKIPPARREHYATAWAADPEGTETLLASLEPGLVPVAEQGHDQAEGAIDGTKSAELIPADGAAEFAGLFGLTKEEILNG